MFHVPEQEELVFSVRYTPDKREAFRVVKWGNRLLMPMYPIQVVFPVLPSYVGALTIDGIDRNYNLTMRYGGAAPRLCGGIVVELGKPISKLLNIDGGSTVCSVRSRVPYLQLHEEVQAN